MSNPLLANLNAFKSKVKSAPVLTTTRKVTKQASPNPTSAISAISSTTSKRSAGDDFDDYEDYPVKARKPVLNAAGSHLSTKLLLAVEYIKERDQPIKIDSLVSYLNLHDDDQRDKLISLIKNLEKIQFDPIDKTLEYVSIHNIKRKDDLLIFLRSQSTFKGISVKELKDGWSGCIQSINELEDEGKILVLRTKKDNHPRLVWANIGGDLGQVDEEFVKIWLSVKLPEPSELPGKLNQLGLKPASVDPATIKKETTQETKKRRQRKGKITNTHMTSILKDFSHMR